MKTDTTNENNITSNVERALLELPPEEQERLMALHEAKKRAAPQENQIEDVTSLGYKKSGIA
ncbi:MAG: hypothetical protein ACMX3H_15535 [Sodalis sp. (in: enterobacteria)]|uniref:hypothetical protein n=1 Tax=Sodalis sp. (in: enterobacteria) TaxID=1898979 RepID=UPI0039E483CB